MSIFDRIAEEKIKAAMSAGEFDHLPGKGKPLSLEENPFEADDARLAHHLIKENEVTLPWIELRQKIEREVEALRAGLRAAMARARGALVAETTLREASVEIARLNREIMMYNAQVPARVFERSTLDLEVELKRAREDAE